VRLHKHLARCGLGSRRACERLVAAGRVSVDGRAVSEQGVCIDPAAQAVEVDGRRVELQGSTVLMLNKPRDILCTSSDPRGRRTFLSLLPRLDERLFTIGRLDRDSEGLLLVTNDGDLAHALMHPSRGVEKKYRVWVDRKLAPGEMSRIRSGINSGDDNLKADDVALVESGADAFVYELRLHEGRNRHIRRMIEALGLKVKRLKRTAVGPLELGSLRLGCWRYLEADEIAGLRNGIALANGDKGGAR
jgi:23S rRNA pseudouridine2605 synthase